ncbi:MAG: ThuA domain-containing protein, partial [Verrucomicrobiota bacterium]
MRFLKPLGVAFALSFFPTHLSFADQNGDGKTVICFVGQQTSHGFGKHEYSAGCHLIEELLRKAYPEATIEGRHAIPWPEEEEEFYQDADAVVFFCTGGPRHPVNGHVPEFDQVMKTGAGLACLHYGVEVPIGPSGKGMLNWMGGYFETNWSVNPHWIASFDSFSDHPAARGIKPFESNDEWYFHMRFVEGLNQVEPILSARAPEETMRRKDGPHSGNPAVRKAVAAGEPQHVAWAYQRGESYNHGRGFGFTGLHYHWNWEEDNFRKTVLNGVAWVAQLDIPENGVPSERPTKHHLE